MEPEIECTECGWQGYISELLCLDEDFNKRDQECVFNICPECGSVGSHEDYEE